jgi:hypothetical protein
MINAMRVGDKGNDKGSKSKDGEGGGNNDKGSNS